MSRNYYSEIYLHIVWRVKGNLQLITPQVEPFLHRELKRRIAVTEGSQCLEVGGIEDHVHLAIRIEPTVRICDLIGTLKGGSAHDINHQFGSGRKLLEWQAGYGVLSFGAGNLSWVREYIQRQREHHANSKSHDRFERIDPLAEETPWPRAKCDDSLSHERP